MRSNRPCSLAALACLSWLTLVACGEPEAPSQAGQLVIIGGGLAADNEEIYDRLVTLVGPEAHWAVLPTASAEPEAAGPRAAERLRDYGADARVIDIHADDLSKARDPDYQEAIAQAGGLFFTGGSQERIIGVFRPEEGDTPTYQGMRALLSRGGVIAGTSAGAAVMSNPMIQRGDAAAALTAGRAYGSNRAAEDGVSIDKGMGFFPYGMTDQHFLTRGRLGRLIVALEATPFTRGYGIDDDRAIHVDLGSARIEALGGPHGLLLLDTSAVRRDRDGQRGLRVALLSSGDVVDGLSGRVTPARGKVPLGRPPGILHQLPAFDDAWAGNVIRELILLLAQNPAKEAVALDPGFELRFEEDDDTQYWLAPDLDAASLTVIGLRLDVLRRNDL
ncbi:MAG: cyanophycinase [Gammaproteobacteria bacterium]|nr:cyanophycinase [Gammaproteobacteria bacterium]